MIATRNDPTSGRTRGYTGATGAREEDACHVIDAIAVTSFKEIPMSLFPKTQSPGTVTGAPNLPEELLAALTPFLTAAPVAEAAA